MSDRGGTAPPAKHEKTPQLTPYQTKMFHAPSRQFFL